MTDLNGVTPELTWTVVKRGQNYGLAVHRG